MSQKNSYITIKLSRSQARWDTNAAALRDYNRCVSAPYLGVGMTPFVNPERVLP